MNTKRYEAEAKAAHDWWRSLRPQERANGYKSPGDRAAIARLRRASSVMDAAAEPATAALFTTLAQANDQAFNRQFPTIGLARASVIAAVLAHVKESGRESIARAIGTPRSGDGSTALITPLRLKRLLAARTPDEVLTGFRRTVAILGHTADVRDLALQLLAWTDDERGDLTRTRFAFDYHGAGQFAPAASANTTDKD
jgi:CRISPR system Cascade subunit CasB